MGFEFSKFLQKRWGSDFYHKNFSHFCLSLSVWCVCVCVLFICTISISILCVSR